MNKLKHLFSPNSTSPTTNTDNKNQKHGFFRRANSGSVIKDDSKKKKSWRSHRSLNPPSKKNDSIGAGALYLDTDISNDNNDLQQQQQFTQSPVEDFLKVPGLDNSISLPYEINLNNPPPPQSPTTRQNEADDFIQQAIQYHEANELEKATYYFKLAAEKDSPLGLFLYGIALRHGWGCNPNPKLAVRYLQKAAESAVTDLHTSVAANPSIARHELVLAIYELGVCFRHGWGVPKNKHTAVYYFEIAANLGDPDAQNELGSCLEHGEGTKKDIKKAAKYYRMAAAQGAGILGNSWIYKKKYDE
ncbi:10514_t:CDS:2 [Scutellospora calospora]|uniref:10514_t:CDS:1 n=1 Tax=Scutellospora calospora TaxID=85575 RepID=A0ACA9K0T2_9GLOM|nr:10514_t:CDS:2 [Scutellospora calospora]